MTVITVDVVSDFICAWCFIGKRQLDQAISLYQKTYPGGRSDEFRITWRPYYLQYNDSATSIHKLDLADTKLAHMTPEQRVILGRRMNRIGNSVGINFQWGGKVGRTHDAHKLVYANRSATTDTQNRLVESLFQAYHEKELDISSRDTLRNIASHLGIADHQITECFDSSAMENAMEAEAEMYRAQTKDYGVPRFIIQERHALSGAQDIQDFMEVFVRVKEETE